MVEKQEFTITSTAFKEGEMIPAKYTADGKDVSPQLKWSNPPAGTKSFALVNDDPDAPKQTWTHWLIKDIPATATEIPEGGKIGVEVKSSFGYTKYGGPAPPSGVHRYFFKLYAMKTEKMMATTKADFYKEVEKNKIGMAQLMGKYTREEL